MPRVATPLFRRALSRRTFLHGLGASIAVPWLDAMQPALRARAAPPLRFVFVFVPNGKKMDEWQPRAWNGPLELPYLLEPLARVSEQVLVLGNMTLDGARAHGDGPGDHARAAAAFLTGVHPKKTGGADVECGVSVDQALAVLGTEATFLPSLELGLEPGRAAGVCDSGYSCAYSNNISWQTKTTPLAKEVAPHAVFARVFGGGARAASTFGLAERLGVLDAVRADAQSLQRRLGVTDRARLQEYLDAVRDIERRLEAAPLVAPAAPAGLDDQGLDYRARLRLMYEIVALALHADATRVVTLMAGNAGSNRSYPFLDVPEGHHTLSHHGGAADKLEKLRRINRFHVEEFATFCQRLASTSEADGTLLDACSLLYGSGIADGNSHAHHDVPIVLVGGAGGRLHGGRSLRPARQTPLANVHLTLLGWAGAERDAFGDSSGTLAL